MTTFDIITIFPEIFEGFLKESIIKRAQEKKLIAIKLHELRKWAGDRHKTVDDKPFGGGRGMVLKVEPIFRAVSDIKKKSKVNPPALEAGSQLERPLSSTRTGQKSKVVLFTPRGRKFDQKLAWRLSKLDQIIFICGRYEGVDERVAKYVADIELSIGDYVLMGGEVPAMAVIEAISRLIPGVLGKSELLHERFTKGNGRAGKGFVEYPQYTRPEIFEPRRYTKDWRSCPPKFRKAKIWRVPKVLISGDHKKIKEWRKKKSFIVD